MAKKSLKKGIFITFEGCEGCGKSTHSKLLYDYLKERSYSCIHTREPGGTRLGERIRDILLHSAGMDISDLTELFLFEAARSQIVKEIIRPAINDKKIILCDRFSDATFSYQGCGGNIPFNVIRSLDNIATDGVMPDLTILLDVDTATGLKRAERKGIDRMESKNIAYHRRVRAGYLKLARANHARIKVIKVADNIRHTQSLVRREVEIVIQKYKK